MPIYDYRCDNCGKTYDVFHKVREVPEDIICPDCASTRHTRLISAPAVSFRTGSLNRGSDNGPTCRDGSCCGGACGLD